MPPSTIHPVSCTHRSLPVLRVPKLHTDRARSPMARLFAYSRKVDLLRIRRSTTLVRLAVSTQASFKRLARWMSPPGSPHGSCRPESSTEPLPMPETRRNSGVDPIIGLDRDHETVALARVDIPEGKRDASRGVSALGVAELLEELLLLRVMQPQNGVHAIQQTLELNALSVGGPARRQVSLKRAKLTGL